MLKMFNKSFIILIICLFCALLPSFADVSAPAVQYLREDYPSAFLSKEDYHIKLNTTRRYKLRCGSEIRAVAIGDTENLKAFENDEPDEEKMLYELSLAKNDIIVRTKHETYTYMQIYMNSENPVTVLLSINSKNKVPPLIRFGNCTMFEDVI